MLTAEAWRDTGTFVDIRGHRMFYRREGQGAPLVLVHGYPTSSWDWARVWPALAARYDVIAMDLLGFGESAKPPGHRYSLLEQTDLVCALVDRLGVDRFHVLAHDYGVTVGQELLARGAPVDSIAFLNGGLFPEMHRARPIQRLLASPVGPLVARLMTERRFVRQLAGVFAKPPPAAELHAYWRLASQRDGTRALQGLIAYMAERRQLRARWVGALLATAVPVLAINGSRDPVSGAHLVDRLLALRPGTPVVRLPDAGHYPQVEDPDAVLAAYFAFRG